MAAVSSVPIGETCVLAPGSLNVAVATTWQLQQTLRGNISGGDKEFKLMGEVLPAWIPRENVGRNFSFRTSLSFRVVRV